MSDERDKRSRAQPAISLPNMLPIGLLLGSDPTGSGRKSDAATYSDEDSTFLHHQGDKKRDGKKKAISPWHNL